MIRSTVTRAAALSGAGLLVVLACAGCSTPSDAAAGASNEAATASPTAVASGPAATGAPASPVRPGTGTPLYLVDGNTGNALGASLPQGLLTGVKGTIPGAATPQEFKDALLLIDPDLTTFSYAAEAYDAVVLAALAAAAANSDAGVEMAKQLTPITNGPEVCSDYAGCLALVKLGKVIDYNGRSGSINFDSGGDPTSAAIGLYTFGSDNTLEPGVEYTQGEIVPDAQAVVPGDGPLQKGAGDGVFRVATFLPATGDLALLGPPEAAGVRLAIRDIEAAGGIPGFDAIELIEGDSGDGSTTTGDQTIKRLLAATPDVLIGASSSAATLSVLDRVTRAGILMISPANSALSLTSVSDKGLYWRISPSDVLQGAVVGAQMLKDGHSRVAIMSRQDEYGDGLNARITQAITDGGGEVVASVVYDPAGPDFAADVAKIKAAQPDAIVLVGFDESAEIILELAKQGIGPNTLG